MDRHDPQADLDPLGLIESRPRRRFTLDAARRTLPLVSRIADDVVRAHAEAAGVHARLSSRPSRELRATLEADLSRAVDRLHRYVDELTELGVELKDYATGLLDFVALHEGREVYLCWRPGEATISHWHELDAGFAGRQPIESFDEMQKAE
jgi:hypothetical protein